MELGTCKWEWEAKRKVLLFINLFSVMIFEFIFAMILYRKIKAIITLKIFAKRR